MNIRDALIEGQPVLLGVDDPLEDRRISAGWIREAIQLGKSVAITNGLIDEPLVLDGMVITTPISLQDVRLESFTARNAEFKNSFRMLNATVVGAIDLTGASFVKHLVLNGLTCHKSLTLTNAEVQMGWNAYNCCFHGVVMAQGMKVGKGLRLHDNAFRNALVMDGTQVQLDANFVNSTFVQSATFSGMKVVGNLLFGSTVFCRKAVLRNTEVGADISFSRALIRELGLIAAKIGGSIWADEITTSSRSKVGPATIDGSVSMRSAAFGGDMSFEGLVVKGDLVLDSAQFSRNVSLNGATVGGDLTMADSFSSRELSLDGIQVGGDFSMNRARADLDARMLNAQISGQTQLEGARFLSSVAIEGLRAGQGVFAESISVRMDASLLLAQVEDDLDLMRANIGGDLTLNRSKVANTLFLRYARIGGGLGLLGARINGDCSLVGVSVAKTLDLRSASVQHLLIDESFARRPPAGRCSVTRIASIDLRGCAYAEIAAYWEPLLNKQTVFDYRPYTQLEAIVKSAGEEGLARDVHFEGHRVSGNLIRPKYEGVFGGSFLSELGRLAADRVWRILGYGVRPQYLLRIAVLVAFIATLGFLSPNATCTNNRDGCRTNKQLTAAESLAYSTRLLLPFDLPVFDELRPTRSPVRISIVTGYVIPLGEADYFADAIKLIGWIIVPVFVGSMAGWLRRGDS
ncbi:MAG TPA: hypothetical protein VFO25_08210 [Candidatus Eremiobacteraceae bacterium]|nr:hypothetical protein [Candidatus Eremiobacteraceae bacterium]